MIERKFVMAASKTAFQVGTSQQQDNYCAEANSIMQHQLQNNSLLLKQQAQPKARNGCEIMLKA